MVIHQSSLQKIPRELKTLLTMSTLNIDYVNTKLNNLRKLILNFRSSFYDSEHVVKPWKANELMYYDWKLAEISIVMQHISNLDRELNKTLQAMKRKFSDVDIALAVKKRKRRQAENAKSDENLKTSRLLARCAEIIKMAAPTDFAHLDCVKMQKEKCITLVISAADFPSAMIKPRYYANALMYLISNGVFIGRAKDNAIEARDAIQKKQIATAEVKKTKTFLLFK